MAELRDNLLELISTLKDLLPETREALENAENWTTSRMLDFYNQFVTSKDGRKYLKSIDSESILELDDVSSSDSETDEETKKFEEECVQLYLENKEYGDSLDSDTEYCIRNGILAEDENGELHLTEYEDLLKKFREKYNSLSATDSDSDDSTLVSLSDSENRSNYSKNLNANAGDNCQSTINTKEKKTEKKSKQTDKEKNKISGVPLNMEGRAKKEKKKQETEDRNLVKKSKDSNDKSRKDKHDKTNAKPVDQSADKRTDIIPRSELNPVKLVDQSAEKQTVENATEVFQQPDQLMEEETIDNQPSNLCENDVKTDIIQPKLECAPRDFPPEQLVIIIGDDEDEVQRVSPQCCGKSSFEGRNVVLTPLVGNVKDEPSITESYVAPTETHTPPKVVSSDEEYNFTLNYNVSSESSDEVETGMSLSEESDDSSRSTNSNDNSKMNINDFINTTSRKRSNSVEKVKRKKKIKRDSKNQEKKKIGILERKKKSNDTSSEEEEKGLLDSDDFEDFSSNEKTKKKKKVRFEIFDDSGSDDNSSKKSEKEMSIVLPQNIKFENIGSLRTELKGLHHKNDEPILPGKRSTSNSKRSSLHLIKKLTEDEALNLFKKLTAVAPPNKKIIDSKKLLLIQNKEDNTMAHEYMLHTETSTLKIYLCKDCLSYNKKVYAMLTKKYKQARHDPNHSSQCRLVTY